MTDELMDDPGLSPDRHRHALSGLRRLNWISGVTSAMDKRLRRMMARVDSDRPVRIIDIASGSGDVPIDLMKRVKRRGDRAELTTVDISEVAIEVQKQAAQKAGVEINAVCADVLAEPPPGHWDIAMCSLFFHHLTSEQIVSLLQAMARFSDRLLVCDLNRSRFNLTCVNVSAQLVTRSDVVHFDANASVRGALTTAELQQLADQALGENKAAVTSVFPCRMMLET